MEQELKEEKERREEQLKMMEGLKEKERQLKEEFEKKQVLFNISVYKYPHLRSTSAKYFVANE